MATMDEQLSALSTAITKVQVASGNTTAQTYAYGSVPPETIVSGSSVDDILSAAQNLNRNLYKAEEEVLLSQIPAVNAWVTPLRQMEQRDGEGNQGPGDKGVNPIHLGHMTVFQDQESKSGLYMSSAKDETFIALEHGPSASYLEIQNDGSMVQGIYGNNYTIIAKDNKVLVQGVCHISVVGDCLLEIQGNKIEHVKGDYKLRVDGEFDVLAKKGISMFTGGDVRLSTGGTTNSIILEAPSELGVITLNGHTNVRGRLTADTIGSEGALSTGFNGGLFVGLGGIVDLGGILCGAPGATGGAPGTITASVSVEAPLGLFGAVSDYSGFLHTLRGIYNIHVHPAYDGPTGTPEAPDGASGTLPTGFTI